RPRGTDEDARAREPEQEPGDGDCAGPPSTQDALEHRDPDRDDGDDERSEPGGDTRLGPRDPAVADEQERRADDRRGQPAAGIRPRAALDGPEEEDGPGE